jgi:hypothetical protein
MSIRSKPNSAAYNHGWEAAFGKKGKSNKKTIGIPCNVCNKPTALREVKKRNVTHTFLTCHNEKCEKYLKPPEVASKSVSKDSFSYRAGSNMAKAEAERRNFEAKAPAHQYNQSEYDDLNNNDSWKEDGYDNEDSIKLS